MLETVILILAYRARASLERSLASIVKAAHRISAGLVFLDNYSRDGSIEFVRQHHPEIDVLMSPRNFMYCDGINAGLQYIHHRYHPTYYVLSDADNIVEREAFEALRQRANADPGAGIVQPLVRSLDGSDTLYSCGHRYDEHYFCRPMSSLPERREVLDDLPSCSILSTLFRGEVLLKCGILEPRFHIYYESSDISFRAKKAGYRCVCEPRAIAYHQGNPGIDYNSYHLQYYVNRNVLLFWRFHNDTYFKEVEHYQSQRLSDLESRYEISTYGLDPLDEAIRTGIRDGLRTARTIDPDSRRVPLLTEYRKGSPSLLHTGISLGLPR